MPFEKALLDPDLALAAGGLNDHVLLVAIFGHNSLLPALYRLKSDYNIPRQCGSNLDLYCFEDGHRHGARSM